MKTKTLDILQIPKPNIWNYLGNKGNLYKQSTLKVTKQTRELLPSTSDTRIIVTLIISYYLGLQLLKASMRYQYLRQPLFSSDRVYNCPLDFSKSDRHVVIEYSITVVVN